MTNAEKLLLDLYVSLKKYDNANNNFRANPSDKTFKEYESTERKLMLAEQKAKDYLDNNNIAIKI